MTNIRYAVIIIIINNKIIMFLILPRINVASIASTEYERVLVNSVSYTPRYLSVTGANASSVKLSPSWMNPNVNSIFVYIQI